MQLRGLLYQISARSSLLGFANLSGVYPLLSVIAQWRTLLGFLDECINDDRCRGGGQVE